MLPLCASWHSPESHDVVICRSWGIDQLRSTDTGAVLDHNGSPSAIADATESAF